MAASTVTKLPLTRLVSIFFFVSMLSSVPQQSEAYGHPLTILAKSSILDVELGTEQASGNCYRIVEHTGQHSGK